MRRELVKSGGGVTLLALVAAAGWLRHDDALAADWNRAAFEAVSVNDVARLWGGAAPVQSREISFHSTPDIAENGAVVPVGVTSAIPRTDAIAILVEKNPNMLAAVFDIPAGTEPSLLTRVKMRQSSNVHALVRAGGRFYVATREVRVTLGACGD